MSSTLYSIQILSVTYRARRVPSSSFISSHNSNGGGGTNSGVGGVVGTVVVGGDATKNGLSGGGGGGGGGGVVGGVGSVGGVEEEEIKKGKKLYLDISSDEQIKRRYFLGRFSSPKTKICQSIVHLTTTPVTLHLLQGTTHAHLGVQTLFEFLNQMEGRGGLMKREQVLSFSFRGRAPVYQIKVAITPVQWSYNFTLNDITCVRQASSWPRKDRPYAEVEFNRSPHSVGGGGCVNRYNLGTFLSHDAASAFIVNNMAFTSVTNFAVEFYVKKLFTSQLIGSISVLPATEYIHNTASLSSFVHSVEDDVVDSNDQLIKGDFARDLASAGSEALVVINNATGERSVILLGLEENATKRLTLSSEEATYEIEITISRSSVSNQQLLRFLGRSPTGGPAFRGTSWHFIKKLQKEAIPLLGDPEANNLLLESSSPSILHQASSQSGFGESVVNSSNFGELTAGNTVEVLIDGLDTFKRYYEAMMAAQHSINILAWELSLSFGLVLVQKAKAPLPTLAPSSGWITLEDVLLSKALSGVRVRVVVWRHELVSYLNRLMYLGEVTIEREVMKLQNRCQKLGLTIRVFHTIKAMPDVGSSYANPFGNSDANIVVIIAGNPEGLVSSHHEKLLLIDGECTEHTVAFIGGFDIARGRYDQPLHQIPKPYIHIPMMEKRVNSSGPEPERYTGRHIQPLLRRIRFLWHDIQIVMKGPAAQKLRLHFAQRWVHCFHPDKNVTRNFSIKLPPEDKFNCSKPHRPVMDPHKAVLCQIGLQRTWKGVFDVGFLFDDYCRMIATAKNFLYLEHQYPFQNGALTYYMCEALQANPNLKLIIVTAVKTDLPSGIVGELFDWSQDHIIDHLNLIQSVAPERVGVFGLVRQDDLSERVKPIYVHSKLAIIDDEYLVIGSTNMDNISFFYSSELSATVISPQLAKDTKVRLFQEHLGTYFKPEMADDFNLAFEGFHQVASDNVRQMKEKECLLGRPVFMAPLEHYQLLMQNVYYPNKVTKLLYKMGVNTEDLFNQTREFATFLKTKAQQSTPNLFRSKL